MRSFAQVVVAVLAAWGVSALAQESEHKAKMQEDLDGYKKTIESKCGITPKIEWTGGKFGHNPRESEKPEWNALTTLCTCALDALANACDNEVVKEKVSKVTTIQCTKGKGTIDYKLKGTTIIFEVDPSFVKNNPAGQDYDLTDKLKKDLDV
jgi:hypothetical protein